MKKIKNTSKYVFAVGDSFTDRDFQSISYPDYDCSYKKWPEIFANKLNSDVLNLAKCGVGNNYIVNTAIDWILDNHKDIRVVVASFTEAWRFDLYAHWPINPLVHRYHTLEESTPALNLDNSEEPIPMLFNMKFNPMEKASRELCDYIMKEFIDPTRFKKATEIMFDDYLANIVRLQKICKQFNLPLVMSALMNPIEYGAFKRISAPKKTPFTYEQLANEFTNSRHFFSIDKKSFIGWPIYEPIGGKNINTELNRNNLIIGELDGHPNAQGHHYIAQKYYDYYFKNYVQK